MKQALRKTPSHLHLAYKYGEGGDSLVGRNFMLHSHDRQLTLAIDLTPNFHTRNKNASNYLDAINLSQNHHKLKFLQCSDNLLRSRLIRAWELVEHPELRMCLDLGPRGHFLYAVLPHSLFMGGIQLDVQEVLDEEAIAATPFTAHHHASRNHQ
ncbi:MAG: hypothetical protein HYX47_07825 [Burkholderiales bacterium]|nr:hypothetical protein [Burkholderiales bacterium]